jgi:hypothetical protein
VRLMARDRRAGHWEIQWRMPPPHIQAHQHEEQEGSTRHPKWNPSISRAGAGHDLQMLAGPLAFNDGLESHLVDEGVLEAGQRGKFDMLHDAG